MGIKIKQGSVWVDPLAIRVKYAEAWTSPVSAWQRVSGAWVKIWQSYTAPAFQAVEVIASGFDFFFGGPSLVSTDRVYLGPVGGEGPYTWSFSYVSGNQVQYYGFGEGPTGYFQPTVFAGEGTHSGVVSATVTDARGNSAYCTCSWTITIGFGP